MKKYEIMAIIVNDLKEKEAQTQVKTSITDRINNLKGKMTFEDFWGARGFAYKIKQQTWGYYFVGQFEMDPTKVAELRNDLNIDTKVVRFLISSVDPKAPAPKKYADMQKANKALEKDKKQEKEPVVVAEKPKKPAEKKAAPAKEEKPAEPAAPKDAVDEKLGKIIEDSALDL